VRLGFVAGVIAQEKLTPFERLLFRATRGNMFLKNSSVGAVLDPTTSEKQEKAVFVVFFAGDRARTKILKVSTVIPIVRISFSTFSRSDFNSILVAQNGAIHRLWKGVKRRFRLFVGYCILYAPGIRASSSSCKFKRW